MQHQPCPKVVDRTLRDICNNGKLFGDIIIVFGRGVHQILLVIIKGSRRQIITTSFRRSLLWDGIHIVRLQQNMRFCLKHLLKINNLQIRCLKLEVATFQSYI
jgi:hypothetical protein